MKKVLFIGSMLLCSMMMINNVNAQSKDEIKEIRKERSEIKKMTKDELSAKVSKAARKEAKNLAKEGWKAAPGAMPIENQLDRSYNMQWEFNGNLMPTYIMGQAMSVGSTYDAAKMQAMTLAKEDLAGQVATEVAVMVESKAKNMEVSDEEAASYVEAAAEGRQLIQQSLGRVMTIVELYRDKGKNKEVMIRIACRSDMIMNDAQRIIRDELKKRGIDDKNKVDQLFDGE